MMVCASLSTDATSRRGWYAWIIWREDIIVVGKWWHCVLCTNAGRKWKKKKRQRKRERKRGKEKRKEKKKEATSFSATNASLYLLQVYYMRRALGVFLFAFGPHRLAFKIGDWVLVKGSCPWLLCLKQQSTWCLFNTPDKFAGLLDSADL